MKRAQRRAAGQRGTRRNPGRVIVQQRTVYAPPAIPVGKVRCEVCRNIVTLTPNGHYRKHYDLTGDACYAVGVVDALLEELPAVDLPPEPREPGLRLARPSQAKGGPRAYGDCEDCGAFVSGERLYCGTCSANRQSRRRL